MKQKTLNRSEYWIFTVVIVVLVMVSIRQAGQLRAIQDEQKKAHYAERLRTAQLILEDEMLRSAYFTSINEETKQLAKDYLSRPPQ